MLKLIAVLIAALLLVAACAPETPPEPEDVDPAALLETVIEQLRDVNTFRLLIEQTGAPYNFYVSLDEGDTFVSATMRRGEAQYLSPNIMFATVNLRIGGLPPIQVELFAEGANQWFKLAGSNWINFPIADGFDPGKLIQDDSGFSAALTQLNDLTYVGAESLIDGTPAYHVRGLAQGAVINELLFDLLELEGEVITDVYIDRETNFPALLEVIVPDTATETDDDTVWRIEIYDVNGDITFDGPPGFDPSQPDADAGSDDA